MKFASDVDGKSWLNDQTNQEVRKREREYKYVRDAMK